MVLILKRHIHFIMKIKREIPPHYTIANANTTGRWKDAMWKNLSNSIHIYLLNKNNNAHKQKRILLRQ